MATDLAWYYQSESGVVGPISSAELRRLVESGAVRSTTRIRRGEDGSWFPAEGIQVELGLAGEEAAKAAPGREPAEWYFARQDGRRLGPVSMTRLGTLLSEGKLQPSDLVWKAGMAAWLPASDLHGLPQPGVTSPSVRAENPGVIPPPVRAENPGVIPPPVRAENPGVIRPLVRVENPDAPPPLVKTSPEPLRNPGSHPALGRIILGGAVAGTLLLGLIVVSAWTWLRARPGPLRDRPVQGKTVVADRTPPRSDSETTAPGGPAGDNVERLYENAIAALRRRQYRQAKTLLDRYASHPDALDPESARSMSREFELASSRVKANELAGGLDDETLKKHLLQGPGPLVKSAIQTPELRPLYRQTLLDALRQESNRRGLRQEGGALLVQKAPPTGRDQPASKVKRPRPSTSGSNPLLATTAPPRTSPGKTPKKKDGRPHPASPPESHTATLDMVLDAPAEFEGKTLRVDGLYKIGTRFSKVKGPDGNPIGWSLPVETNDGVAICNGETKVRGRDTYLLLDEEFARFLDRVFQRLRIHTSPKPIHKCIITVAVRSLAIDRNNAPVAHIVGLEILGAYNPLKVIQNRYNDAFVVARITPGNADINHGDGALWVERLGGEEKFVLPARRKYRELVRRVAAERDQAIVARYLQGQLSSVMTMAAAAQQRQSQAFAAMIGQVLR